MTQYRPLSAGCRPSRPCTARAGFSVDTEIVDSPSLKPGLLKLYEIVLHAGRKPEDTGLPPLNGTGQTLVGRATLRDREGGSWPPPRRPKNPSSPTRIWRCWKPPRVSVCWRRWASVARSWTRTKPGIRPIRAGYPQPIVPAVPATRAVGATLIVPRRPSRTRRDSSVHPGCGGGPGIQPGRSGGRGRRGGDAVGCGGRDSPVASPPAPAPVAAPPVSDRDARALTA